MTAQDRISEGDHCKDNTGTNSFSFTLNKSTDLMAYEKTTGFGVNVYNATSGSTVADNLSVVVVTVNAGALSISKKSTSPADTTIVKGSDNVMLLANLRADEKISADGLNVVYSSVNSSSTQFENVRVYLNGLLQDSLTRDRLYQGWTALTQPVIIVKIIQS
jgi:hypothetical protein